MENLKIERHPFTPFLPEGCKVVMCGTFPPKQDKWAMDFFYPNFYNDMWRIFGLIFFDDKDHFFDLTTKTVDKTAIQQMLTANKIGIGETVTQAVRTKDNASDKYLEIMTPVDLPALLAKVPVCSDLVTTGEKAASVIANLTDTEIPKIGENRICKVKMPDGNEREIRHWRMPSTSRAYPMKLEKKMQFYKEMLEEIRII
ncbi:MAG: uracil-DNA glycosylase family protein [Muribaculaceae bacterium]|nr:uracil-DNA glycosylase family protein [Muribaculaceae bacterium]